jgi:two-component system nitrate/nitrite response regulator NarL
MSQETLTPVKIMLVDDHALFREGLSRMLESLPGFCIVAKADSVRTALGELEERSPDLVLLDVDLGGDRAVDFLVRAREGGYAGKVLIVTAGVPDREAFRLMQLGASGILLKHKPPEVLADAVRRVLAGEVFLEQRLLQVLLRPPEAAGENAAGQLSDRERRILRLVFQGLANKEIASRMELSESTVKAVLRQLFHKLGVRTRSQLVKVALETLRDEL